eukprot:TRINITY_DN5742_c0_g1_i5.p1 TRINITY_DN5742_c0_g1~~TRINITY_DN5742_c0_g1_i5.p1  ORF type:complete len:797 (-),score=127.71 TRINITY_DN5742_c0_g1_i5:730-3120(-)
MKTLSQFLSDLDEMKMLKITLPDEAHRLTLQVLSKVNQPHLVLRHWEQNFLGESRRILSLSDYHIIFDAISQLKKSDKALELHQQMHAQSILPDTHIQNAILRSFEDQEAFASPERISTPINLYETWLRSGYSLQTSTLNTLLYMLRGKLSVESALRLVQKSKDAGVSLDPSIKSSLVGIMASCGRIPDALYLANVLTLDSSAISTAYANILHGCSALDGPTILRLWNDMMIDICPLNKTLASAFLEANSRLSDPTLTKIILDRIDKEGINLTTADINNALINFAQNGDMVGFQSTHHRYFSTTNQRTPNTETRLIEIQGYCKTGQAEQAFDAFRRLQQHNSCQLHSDNLLKTLSLLAELLMASSKYTNLAEVCNYFPKGDMNAYYTFAEAILRRRKVDGEKNIKREDTESFGVKTSVLGDFLRNGDYKRALRLQKIGPLSAAFHASVFDVFPRASSFVPMYEAFDSLRQRIQESKIAHSSFVKAMLRCKVTAAEQDTYVLTLEHILQSMQKTFTMESSMQNQLLEVMLLARMNKSKEAVEKLFAISIDKPTRDCWASYLDALNIILKYTSNMPVERSEFFGKTLDPLRKGKSSELDIRNLLSATRISLAYAPPEYFVHFFEQLSSASLTICDEQLTEKRLELEQSPFFEMPIVKPSAEWRKDHAKPAWDSWKQCAIDKELSQTLSPLQKDIVSIIHKGLEALKRLDDRSLFVSFSTILNTHLTGLRTHWAVHHAFISSRLGVVDHIFKDLDATISSRDTILRQRLYAKVITNLVAVGLPDTASQGKLYSVLDNQC